MLIYMKTYKFQSSIFMDKNLISEIKPNNILFWNL